MELVKDVDTDYKDYMFIRNILKKGYSHESTILGLCIKHNMKNCRQKLYDLVDLGQVEKIEVERSIGVEDYERKYKYVLKKTDLSCYAAAGVDKLGGWQADSEIKRRLDFNSLLLMISKFYDESKIDIISTSRKRELVIPRQMFCYIARFNIPNITFSQIGNFLGNRDHSTVIHSVNQAENFMSYDKQFQTDYRRLVDFINKKLG